MNEFTTGQHLLAFPEVKRYVLTNLFSDEKHLVTEEMLRDAFTGNEYNRVMSNRNAGWMVEDYYD
ncbi:protein GP45.2 [Klebsiella variicola]|uniref:protein GP45.2 n=1 Tax=Klebsiella variicola TaxID=244366 RepID=UPI000D74ABB7|nr:protein GP45.2 [Klebsiella variicola]PXM00542.1 hypothetical protein DMT40_26120 [Klebsiella variicola]